MFLINLKTAFRYLKKNIQFTSINILGLTLGFFCFFLLNSYVLKETSFDKNQESVYRLLQKSTDENGTVREMAQTAPKIGIESNILFDEIVEKTQIMYVGRSTIGRNPNNLNHEPLAILDDSFLSVFDFELEEGSTSSLLNHANGIILTKSLKEKYFGNETALSKTLKVYGNEFEIVGVLNDFPENSHLENMIFITEQMASDTFRWYNDFVGTDWSRSELITYFKISPNVDLNALGTKITDLAAENNSSNESYNSTFSLQPIQNIHLYKGQVEGEINKNKGNALYVNLFFWVAIFILLVACFNYAGLQNIAFIGRSKEIGLRQIVGAKKTQLLWQFLSESLLLTMVSMGLAYGILWLSQPLINIWFDTSLNLGGIPIQGIFLTLVAGLFLSLLSVAYPFWLIIRTSMSSTLKQTVSGGSKLPFRRFMLVFQSIAVIAFLTASLVFNQQMNFLKSKELGFEMQGLATVDINSGILRNKFESIKEEFLRIPEVSAVSVTSRVPGEWKNIPVIKAMHTGQSVEHAKDMLFICADKDFLQTYNINLIEGVNFSGVSSDSTKVFLNESAVIALGLQNPIGQYVEVPSVNFGGGNNNLETVFRAKIAGIVKDFQIEDFRTSIKPLIIGNWNNPIHSIDYYTLQIETKNWASTLAALKNVNDSFDPNTPIEFNILDDKFARFFEKEILRFKLLSFFSGIIIFLACMGLFSMSAFVAKTRAKEISIRKVVGASILQLFNLLSQDFVKLMLISFVIAAPITWYLLSNWLLDFAYHIDLKWWMLVMAGLGCLTITIITVSFQSIKAATVNPIKSLRTE